MKYLTIILLTIFSFGFLQSQNNDISISTGFMIVNNNRVQLINVQIPGNVENLDDRFQKWMNEQYDYGLDGGKILEFTNYTYSAVGSFMPDVSNLQIDLFMREKYDLQRNKTTLTFYASHGFDTWINAESHPFEFRSLTSVIKQFAYSYLYNEVVISQ